MSTRRTTRRRPDAKQVRGFGGTYSDPSHPRVGLHTSQTRRTCAANGVTFRPDAGTASKSWDAAA